MPLYFTPFVKVPVLTTIHGFSSEKIKKVYRRYAALPHVHYVAISEADKDPGLPYLGVVHHGVDPRRFRVGEGGGTSSSSPASTRTRASGRPSSSPESRAFP